MRRRNLPAAQLPLPLGAEAEAEAETDAETEAERLERYIAWIDRIWDNPRPLTEAERRQAGEIAAWALARGYWNLNLFAELITTRRTDML